jgi:hypothetical protein
MMESYWIYISTHTNTIIYRTQTWSTKIYYKGITKIATIQIDDEFLIIQYAPQQYQAICPVLFHWVDATNNLPDFFYVSVYAIIWDIIWKNCDAIDLFVLIYWNW